LAAAEKEEMAALQKAFSRKLQLAWQNVLQTQKTVKEADIAITAAAEGIVSIMNALSAAKANAQHLSNGIVVATALQDKLYSTYREAKGSVKQVDIADNLAIRRAKLVRDEAKASWKAAVESRATLVSKHGQALLAIQQCEIESYPLNGEAARTKAYRASLDMLWSGAKAKLRAVLGEIESYNITRRMPFLVRVLYYY
jgi:hypothetical protein